VTDAARSYVVTAASGGIGGALVTLLLGRGDNVFAVDISGKRNAALEARFAGSKGKLVTLKADVTDEAAAADAVKKAIETFGRIDGLANIAGGIVGIGTDLIDCDIEKVSAEDFRGSFRLNVDSAFLMIRALVPHFAGNGYGKVVNVASMAALGRFSDMGNPAYDPAKAAVIGLTKTLCRRLGPRGIRVNVVAPGGVFTERVIAAFPAEFIEKQRTRAPLQRLTKPEDVAHALDFFLSPASDQISGELLCVAGGLQ
jgi:NAD(P)-dependent dehydrogenase (short-subunit alcohol dehydrogenase family)